MKIANALLILYFLSSACVPADAQTVFGAYDCGHWINRVKGEQIENWLSGYLSGLNVAHTKAGMLPPDPLSELNSMDQARVWVDNFCRANPLSKINGAGVELFKELIAKRGN